METPVKRRECQDFTITKDRGKTAVNMQELLTYVEELTFKTSMFGYDKDEVDIQLDKICDEVELIVKAKDQEIEALKAESKTAVDSAAAIPEHSDGETPQEMSSVPEEAEAAAGEQPESQEDAVATAAVPTEPADSAAFESLKAELEERKTALAEALQRAEKAETALKAEKARADEAEAALKAEKAKADEAAAKLAEQTGAAAEAQPSEKEAYEHYMKNADLLCRQLSDLESRQDGILAEAREQARAEKENAQKEAAEIVGEARRTAEQVLRDAEESKKSLLEEAQKLRGEKLLEAEREQKHCEELAARRETMVQTLKKLTEDTAQLMEKIQAQEL